MVEETEVRLLCPEILSDAPWRYPETVRFVPEALVKPRLVVEAFVAKNVVPVALVKEMPVEETVPPRRCNTPDPVALVNVRPVEETEVTMSVVPVALVNLKPVMVELFE